MPGTQHQGDQGGACPPPTLFAADIFHKFTYKKLKYHGVYYRKEDFQLRKFCLGLYHEEKVTFNRAIYVQGNYTFSGGMGVGRSCLMQKYWGTCTPKAELFLTVPQGVSIPGAVLVQRAVIRCMALLYMASRDSEGTREVFLQKRKEF